MAGALPERVAGAVGGALGWVAGVVLRIRRGHVDRHLTIAFPDASRRWRARVARGCYRHLGREMVSTLRMAGLDRAAVIRRTEIEDLPLLEADLEEGRGVVLVSGHLGNWEIAAAALAARGVPLTAVALRQANPLFDRDILRTREGLGVRIVYRENAPREVLRALSRGDAIGLVADQNPLRGGILVDFFGFPANTARGPAVFALRAGVPIFLINGFRRSGPRAHYDIEVERIAPPSVEDQEEATRSLVQAYTERLEAAVRKAPEQYFWPHRRWRERS